MTTHSDSPAPNADARLGAVLDALRRSVPAAKAHDAEIFARAFYARMESDEYAIRTSDAWAALARGYLEFMHQRAPGNTALRIFNPTLEQHGWESPHTVIQIANDDMPFLVDSVSMVLDANRVGIHVLGHPVLEVERDAAGVATRFGTGRTESLIHIEIDRQIGPAGFLRLERAILSALEDVRACVVDWRAMRERALESAERLSRAATRLPRERVEEACEFLRWAADDHFVFLGYREYALGTTPEDAVLRALPEGGLGLLRSDQRAGRPRSVRGVLDSLTASHSEPDALILTKTNARSTVHRAGYMDYIGVLEFDAAGRTTGERRFIGLFTSSAYSARAWDIPLVRQRHAFVMNQSGLAPDSHSGKALRQILEILPRDELFQSNSHELHRTAMSVLALQERIRPRLFVRRDRFGRFFSILAYVPRDRFNAEVGRRIEAMLMDALTGQQIDTTSHVGSSPLAQIHMIVRPKAGAPENVDVDDLNQQLAGIVRSWHDALREQLVQRCGEAEGLRLASRFARALPAGYVAEVSSEVAADDVIRLAALGGDDGLGLNLYLHHAKDQAPQLRFKIYRTGRDISLSEALPLLENLGLRIQTERPYALHVGDANTYIQDFEIEAIGAVDVDAVRSRFEQAFENIWRGRAESDGFNRLVLAARLDWRQVAMLRGYAKYLLQVGVPFSQSYMEETLARYPLVARLLVELFEARFHPDEDNTQKAAGQKDFGTELQALVGGDETAMKAVEPVIAARLDGRQAQMEAARLALLAVLDQVASIDEDRILRSFKTAMLATLRTSFYQAGKPRAQEVIAFKIDPSAMPESPKPRPYREIFVYGPRVEGTHLRFGPVARGGLRWSDRREDFRTEVLGLVKAQMVKNTVIVPVGAKGGFFVKRPPTDREAVLAEGIDCYKLFIGSMLDITDNIIEGKIVPPQDVVRHDEDDPYLVVAADKGTARFSDIANGLALEEDFWLGDAFASGGSVGYSHKGMGITARGAWESVKRHFLALGRDCQNEDFTCVGIGDMSGDVFGNGMLLSKHTRLVVAFDHRDIFIDPNPDAATSWAERERLFNLPRSSWADYNRELISAGGGVFARSLKSISITPQVRALLALPEDTEHLTPNELIIAALCAPVDLVYNGGIGTYIKASSETHADVGDRANNAIRINGNQLRCRIIGEGGNLGMTQRGRIEAALAGVILNTDAIDNSAGVDTSDHEVNIKILLNDVVAHDQLDAQSRAALLQEMTDEVADLVLRDNIRQNEALSLMERMSVVRLGSKQHFIRTLESQGLLDRQIEFLPSDAEISERKARGEGLTRPELAVLLAYAKMTVYNQLVDSDVPEDPFLSAELQRYFPTPLQERFAENMQRHRLKREIIATAVTNSMVNRMGATFLLRMQEDTGESAAQVAKAYTIARVIGEARDLWHGIDALSLSVPDRSRLDALMLVWHKLRGMTRWLLNLPGVNLDIAASVERYGAGIAALRAGLDQVLSEQDRLAYADARARWMDEGFPQEMAEQLASMPLLGSALDIVQVALEHGFDVLDVARTYFGLGQALNLAWFGERIDALPVEGRWHALARGSLRDELQAQQSALVAQILQSGSGKPTARLAAWLAREDSGLRFTVAMLQEMRSQREMDYPTASVALRRLAQLVQHAG
jgi:glutamate dehydrogenase